VHTIGFIYPDHAAEDDYPYAEQLLEGTASAAKLVVEYIYGTDLHAVAELMDLGSPAKLADGAAKLAKHSPTAVVWACTSGSFVYRPDGAAEQARKLSEAAGVPASSTSFAFTNAAQALGVRRVAVAASYPEDIAALFEEFLSHHGLKVVSRTSAGIDTAAEVGRLRPDEVVALAAANDHPDADALLIPDTAMHTLRVVPTIEERIGKPVLTANQVTVWEGLRLAGLPQRAEQLGALFR